MDATAFHSLIMVFGKATALAHSSLKSHGKALEQESGVPGVFCDCSDESANFLCQLYRHLMHATHHTLLVLLLAAHMQCTYGE